MGHFARICARSTGNMQTKCFGSEGKWNEKSLTAVSRQDSSCVLELLLSYCRHVGRPRAATWQTFWRLFAWLFSPHWPNYRALKISCNFIPGSEVFWIASLAVEYLIFLINLCVFVDFLQDFSAMPCIHIMSRWKTIRKLHDSKWTHSNCIVGILFSFIDCIKCERKKCSSCA